MIADVRVQPLRQIEDPRGKIMHMLRRDAAGFTQFGEIYFSCVNPNAIKGWNLHKRMTLNIAVPYGKVLLALYDERPDSPTAGEAQQILLGENNYNLVTIPPLIWTSFKGIGDTTAIVANCASLPHDPDEVERRAIDDPRISFRWSDFHGL